MDDTRHSQDMGPLPLRTGPWEKDEFPDVTPLRLALLPSGFTVELNRPDMVVGRHSESDVRLPLPDVSRRHCRFVFNDGSWQVFDLESLNGIYLNGERVSQAILHDRDTLGIGGFQFRLELIVSQPNPADESDAGAGVIKKIADALLPVQDRSIQQRKAS